MTNSSKHSRNTLSALDVKVKVVIEKNRAVIQTPQRGTAGLLGARNCLRLGSGLGLVSGGILVAGGRVAGMALLKSF